MLFSLLALTVVGVILPLFPVSAMGTATVQGTIGLANHGNAPRSGAKVVIKVGSTIIGQDYTNSDGYYHIITDPVSPRTYVTMKITYTKSGYYGPSHWCKPKTISFRISPGGHYLKNVNLYDNSENKQITFLLQYTTRRRFYFTASWKCSYNPYTNKATIRFNSWYANIDADEMASEIYFAFGAYKDWPYNSGNEIYSFADFFEYNNGWSTLSGSPGVSTSNGCITLIDMDHGTWSTVLWDSYNGDYWQKFGFYGTAMPLTY